MPLRNRAAEVYWDIFTKSWRKEAENYADLETASRLVNSGDQSCSHQKWLRTCEKRWTEHHFSNKNKAATSQAYRSFGELLKTETYLIRFISERDDVLPRQGDLKRLIHHATKRGFRGLIDLWNNRDNWAQKAKTVNQRTVATTMPSHVQPAGGSLAPVEL
ncbi:hypothetical protein QC763_0052670 [Podospora pseudopauciseta]|uniref:Uncharacterized protein n=1 Tax=Podospora pseudopauciseta TaxID=2093780 RepID=A0ABR0HFY1_9PEZI|nr:hypothetical protein QC763_0052670 [Podospora pseudopauciseta]